MSQPKHPAPGARQRPKDSVQEPGSGARDGAHCKGNRLQQPLPSALELEAFKARGSLNTKDSSHRLPIRLAGEER